jgi:hypothetical protein
LLSSSAPSWPRAGGRHDRNGIAADTLGDKVDWYTQANVGSDVIRISEPHVNELVSANFWWLRGNDRDIVIDAGLGVVALREAIPGMFGIDAEGEPVPSS